VDEEDDEDDEERQFDMIDLQDDFEPEPMEKVPGGSITAEWLAFRHHSKTDRELELDNNPLDDLGGNTWEKLLSDPFDEVEMTRGHKREEAGMLKCQVRVYKHFPDKHDEMAEGEYRDMMNPKKLHQRIVMQEAFPADEVEVRVFILRAFQMSPIEVSDGVAKADNYIKLTLGSQKPIADVASKLSCLNPEFYKTYIMHTRLPGESRLHVNMLDYNALEGDKLIGATTIDLEDRWFCKEEEDDGSAGPEWWKEMIIKPIEKRDLYHPDKPGVTQGKMELFVDILDMATAGERPPEDINVVSKSLRLQMRVIIWETAKVAPKDKYTSDIYVVCDLLNVKSDKTDVHPNCKKAQKGFFNFRMLFDVRYPDKHDYLMRIQLWDENLALSDESIAEGIIPLESLFREAFDRNVGKVMIEDMEEVWLPPREGRSGDVIHIEDAGSYPFRWYDFHHPNTGFGPRNVQGKLCLSLVIMPRALAKKQVAGRSRNPPQQLPEPVRPPTPANPIFEPEKCNAYIKYQIKEFFLNRKWCILCSCCTILAALIIAAMMTVRQAFGI